MPTQRRGASGLTASVATSTSEDIYGHPPSLYFFLSPSLFLFRHPCLSNRLSVSSNRQHLRLLRCFTCLLFCWYGIFGMRTTGVSSIHNDMIHGNGITKAFFTCSWERFDFVFGLEQAHGLLFFFSMEGYRAQAYFMYRLSRNIARSKQATISCFLFFFLIFYLWILWVFGFFFIFLLSAFIYLVSSLVFVSFGKTN